MKIRVKMESNQRLNESNKSDIIEIVTRSISHDISLHHLHSHIYGDSKELTFHIRLPADMKLE
jgi:hypothetical protein